MKVTRRKVGRREARAVVPPPQGARLGAHGAGETSGTLLFPPGGSRRAGPPGARPFPRWLLVPGCRTGLTLAPAGPGFPGSRHLPPSNCRPLSARRLLLSTASHARNSARLGLLSALAGKRRWDLWERWWLKGGHIWFPFTGTPGHFLVPDPLRGTPRRWRGAATLPAQPPTTPPLHACEGGRGPGQATLSGVHCCPGSAEPG